MTYLINMKQHPIYKHIWCDEQGDVYSSKRKINLGFGRGNRYDDIGIPKKLSKCTNTTGYTHYAVQINNKPKMRSGHRLVYECFNGVIPEGMQVDHIDLDVLNNKPENLRLATQKENTWHRKSKNVYKVHGRYQVKVITDGIKHWKSFDNITEAQEFREFTMNSTRDPKWVRAMQT